MLFVLDANKCIAYTGSNQITHESAYDVIPYGKIRKKCRITFFHSHRKVILYVKISRKCRIQFFSYGALFSRKIN